MPRIRLARLARNWLPGLLQRSAGIFRNLCRVTLGLCPRATEIVARPECTSDECVVRARENSIATISLVVQHRVNREAPKMRSVDFPFLARFIGAQHECALHRSDKKKHFTGSIRALLRHFVLVQ